MNTSLTIFLNQLINMISKKTLSNSIFFVFALIGSISFLEKPVKAEESPICPDPSTTSITSLADENDSSSFIALTGGEEGGFCRGTPDTYGVKVYKMGFCTKNPGNPSGSSVLEGSVPNYSTCTWAFESTAGETADFGPGGSIDLSEANSSLPASGIYPHAVMLISKDFRIKGKYGPVAGVTYYSTSEFEKSSTSISEYSITTAPLTSFSGPTECSAYTENETVVGGTISAYLLDSTGTMLVSDETENTGSPCTGQVKLLGVMNMTDSLTISESTKGLKMTFVVTNNGMSVISNSDGNSPPTALYMDSGPFSVTFETF